MKLPPTEWMLLNLLAQSYRGLQIFSLFKATGIGIGELGKAIARLTDYEFLTLDRETQILKITATGQEFLLRAKKRKNIVEKETPLSKTSEIPLRRFGASPWQLAINSPYVPKLSELSEKFGKPSRKAPKISAKMSTVGGAKARRWS